MRVVSVAKSAGSGHVLYPEGHTAETIPHDLHSAIEQAMRILNWQENLPSDEMPPRWMWSLDWELEVHFSDVERKREDRYNNPGSTSDSGETGEEVWDDNAYAARFRD